MAPTIPLYGPLPGDKIRLLKLHSPTAGTLVDATIDEHYSALSYCWGSSQKSEEITINGQALHITPTLKAALRRLSGTVWIDQICINQEDDHEKSQQVMIMGDVYRHAQKVYVHLGDDPYNLAPLTKALDKTEYAQRTRPLADPSKHTQLIKTIRAAGSSDPDVDAIRLLQITYNPYFSRMWVLQECALAGTAKLSFLLGNAELTWHQIRATAWLGMHIDIRQSKFEEYDLDFQGMGRIAKIATMLDSESASDMASHDLLGLVHRFAIDWHVTNPRDRFYSLYALATDQQSLPAIDYSRSVAEVYMEQTAHMLRNPLGGHMLNLVVTLARFQDDSVPSWCLSANSPTPGVNLWPIARIDCADKGLQQASLRVGAHLRVIGLIIDSIVPPVPQPRDLADLEALFKSARDIPYLSHLEQLIYFHYRGDPRQAFVEALGTLATLYLPMMYHYAALDGQPLPLRPESFWRVENKDWRLAVKEAINKDVSVQWTYVSSILKNWRVISSTKGYVGLSRDDTATGDVVAILAGVQQPVILRPRPEAFRLLGKARLVGMMLGEVTTDQKIRAEAVVKGIWLC